MTETRVTPGPLQIRRDGAAVWLTLSRPESLNAFDADLQAELRDALEDAAVNRRIRSVVIAGEGRAFCAGADLDLADLGPQDRLGPRTESELRLRYNPIVKQIRTMPKPVVAAVNGPAVGVGCALAMACDHVVASESASFSLAFSAVGLTLDAGASALMGARVGFGRLSRLALWGEKVPANRALDWGMVDEVVPSGALGDRSAAVAEKLGSGPTRAFAATKRSINAALLPHLDTVFEVEVAGQTELVDSPDFREGAAAFAERRRPEFRG